MTSNQKRRPDEGTALFNRGGGNSADLNSAGDISQRTFPTCRDAALALLNGSMPLTRKAGSFLGQCVADPAPLTDRQAEWLKQLLAKAELPPFVEGAQ